MILPIAKIWEIHNLPKIHMQNYKSKFETTIKKQTNQNNDIYDEHLNKCTHRTIIYGPKQTTNQKYNIQL